MNKPMMHLLLLSFFLMLMNLMSRQQHILPNLLCLEGMMLFMIMFIPIMLNIQLTKMSHLISILLMMSVSSTSIGIALMVMMSRNEGSDCPPNQIMKLC